MNNNLKLFDRYSMRPLVIFVIALTFGMPAGAQTPQGDPPSISLPDSVQPVEDPKAAAQIERALEGDSLTPLPGGALGDVIEIIRKQGSILDGSSLDRGAADSILTPQDSANSSSTLRAVSRVKTAEALLRSARMLESLTTRRPQQLIEQSDVIPLSELVRQMRIQAARLLAKEFPQAVQ